MQRALTKIGITDPALRKSYELCRTINSHHGKTYYLAALLLPSQKRPFVHALYGFARSVDDIVDDESGRRSLENRIAALDHVEQLFLRDLARGQSNHRVLAAVVDTACRWHIPQADFEAFFAAMRADLSARSYATYEDLRAYMYGSASVIGRQMLPILAPSSPEADKYAEQLGEAFQLANFIRDVGEDLDRGRVYLPLDELARFGVTPATLARRQVTDDLRHALDFQISRVHQLSVSAAPGIALLHPSSRDCVATARILYCEIADAVAKIDYQVFTRRAAVPVGRRLAVALPAWKQATIARRRYGPGPIPRAG